MAQELYQGAYLRFFAMSETGGADFMGADNLVGDRFTIEIQDQGDSYKAFLVNRFGAIIGYLDPAKVRQVQLAQAKGWKTDAFLSFVAFTEGKGQENPGYYWGEMAVLAYDERLSPSIEVFEKKLSSAMADGARPQVDFGKKAIDQLLAAKGDWFPTEKKARPKMEKGSSVVKDHRTPNEHLIEQSRAGNKGCYVISWAFIILLAAALLYTLHSCGLF